MAERPGRGAAAKAGRYAVAGIGPIASAGVQFLQSLALLKVLSPHDFGRFSFLLVASSFSWGLWSALFCAPLPTLVARADPDTRARVLRTLFSTNLVAAAAGGLLFFALALGVGLDTGAALLFAGYAAVALLRWFARSCAYVEGRPVRTMASDLTYSATLLGAVGIVVFGHAESLHVTYAALFASSILGMLPFGAGYLKRQFARIDVAAIRDYAPIFRRFSGWSLVGVGTTEATANAHAYIVTAVMGPSAFAPVAASALMIRPIGVALNALSEFERAQMAKEIGAGRLDAADRAVSFFRRVMILVWLATGIAAGVVLLRAPELLFPPRYPVPFLTQAAALWLLVAAVRLVRAPESAFLQAAGAFGPLARTSMVSCIVSVVSVTLLLWYGGLLWSIGGIFLGEAVFAYRTWRQARGWLAAARAGASRAAAIAAE